MRMTRWITLALILGFALFGLASMASAQTTVTNPTGTKLEWNHDQVGLDQAGGGFRLYIADQVGTALGQVDVPYVKSANNLFSAPFPAMTPGLRTLNVTAYNQFAESLKSNTISVRLVVITAPTNFKLAKLIPTPWGRKPGVALMLGYTTADGVWHPELRVVQTGLKRDAV